MFGIAKRRLGRDGPEVSAIGLGCMGMSEFYVGGSEQESIATIHHALDRGVTFLDTADMYGWGANEELEVRVAEAPSDGAANEAVVKLLAKALGVSRSEVSIIAGRTGRHKRVAIPFDLVEARRRLGRQEKGRSACSE